MRLRLGRAGVDLLPADWATESGPPHALIAGETGSGKSVLTRSLVDQAGDTAQLDVWVADGKAGGDFSHSAASLLALGPSETVELVERAAEEASRRIALLAQSGERTSTERALLVVVDELAASQLRARGEDARVHRDRRDRLQAALAQLALTGRAGRVHLLAVMQRPDTDAVPGPVRDQVGLRIALGWMSADGYRMIFGLSDIQSPTVREPGRGWIAGHAGHWGSPTIFVANPSRATQ